MWESECSTGAERSGNLVMNGYVCRVGGCRWRAIMRGFGFAGIDLTAVTVVYLSGILLRVFFKIPSGTGGFLEGWV